MRRVEWLRSSLVVLAAPMAFVAACGSTKGNGSTFDGGIAGGDDGGLTSDATMTGLGDGSSGANDSGSIGFNFDSGPTGCSGYSCVVHACPTDGGTTSVSGTVYDPAAKNPLYNVVVYVPASMPSAFTSGASCDSCGALYTGNPVASALTDADGKFTLTGVPDGPNIPLVIQIGKWRKQMTVPMVTACQDNPMMDKTLTLPKNHTEGDIPKMAISTGNSDTLECLLRRIGIDADEYQAGGSSGGGRLDIFAGGNPAQTNTGSVGADPGGQGANTSPPGPTSFSALWDSATDLMKYDIVLLSCEGAETYDKNQAAFFSYANAGGRIFASHYHYALFNTGPFGDENLATWFTSANAIGNINATINQTLPGGATFPKGVAMQEWLSNVGALTSGKLPIQDAKHNANVGMANTKSTPWISYDLPVADASTPEKITEYLSFDTPFDLDGGQACGRTVFSDLHVGAASMDDPSMPVPAECSTGDLSPQEKALEFMLFDLSSCVTPNGETPAPPPVIH